MLTQLDGFNNAADYDGGSGVTVADLRQAEQWASGAAPGPDGAQPTPADLLRDRLNKNVVKVIFATNKPEVLDPALLRTGRCDRKVFVDHPTKRERRLIFQVCARRMSLAKDVDFEPFVAKNARISGADVAQVCREAGMQAIRENRFVVFQRDFERAWEVTMGRRKAPDVTI